MTTALETTAYMDLLHEQPTDVKRQPWGMLPPRMRVLFVTTPSHTGSWLAEAFAADSASQVILEETIGVVHGLARLRDEVFDVVLIAHDEQELDALEILDAVRTGANPNQPIVVLGSVPAAELEAVCMESGADAYMTWDATTTRSLIWQIARASERHQLLEENRQLRQAKNHQRDIDEAESNRMLEIQKRLAEGLASSSAAAEAIRLSETSSGWQAPPQLVDLYAELSWTDRKYSLLSTTSGLIVGAPAFQLAGQTSPCNSECWSACTNRNASSTFRPRGRSFTSWCRTIPS